MCVCPALVDTAKRFSRMYSYQEYMRFHFLHILAKIWHCQSFNLSILVILCYLIVVLIYTPQMSNKIKKLFHVVLVIVKYPFCEVTVQVVAHFLYSVCIFVIDWWKFCIYSEHKSFLVSFICFANSLLHSVVCLFTLLMVSLIERFVLCLLSKFYKYLSILWDSVLFKLESTVFKHLDQANWICSTVQFPETIRATAYLWQGT